MVLNVPGYWGSFATPSQPTANIHIQGGDLQVDASAGFAAVLYNTIADYSSGSAGPYSVTREVLPLDPFLLPILDGTQTAVAATQLSLPAKSKLILPNVSTDGVTVTGEGIAAYVTQSSGNTVIDEATGISNGSGALSFSYATLESGADTSGTIYNLDPAARDDSTPRRPIFLI